MSWCNPFEFDGHLIEVDSGSPLLCLWPEWKEGRPPAGPRLCLTAHSIADMTDAQIVEAARWFTDHAPEIEAIYLGDECNFSDQFITEDQLRLIIDGELACPRIKDAATIEWEHRHGIFAIPAQHHIKRDKPAKIKKPGFVYLAYSETNHYKIGKSQGPAGRISVFNTQMPLEVTMLYTFQADDMRDAEAILHGQYADKRVKGEWFELAPKDIEEIKAIVSYQDGAFVR